MLFALAVLSSALAACSAETVIETTTVHGTALDHGRALFSDPGASPSTINAFSCSTCHSTESAPNAGGRIFAGAPLAGVTERPTFWGGQENDLLRSMNDCRFYFMAAQKPWTVDDEEAKVLYGFLASLPNEVTGAAAFTVVQPVKDLAAGDSARGGQVFASACQTCHGAAHTGEGRLTETAPALPDETIAEHTTYSATDQRVVFIEKLRHGGFLGYGGTMPPFSLEVLSDEQVADLLAFFQVYP
jgi:thiosulfate dehydrogenase